MAFGKLQTRDLNDDFVLPIEKGGIGATTAEEALANLSGVKTSDLTTHTGNTSNPHGVTAAQVGAFSTSSIIPISNGGTGTNNATTALSNLGGVPKD